LIPDELLPIWKMAGSKWQETTLEVLDLMTNLQEFI
jgi:hypothetical protein